MNSDIKEHLEIVLGYYNSELLQLIQFSNSPAYAAAIKELREKINNCKQCIESL